MTVVERKGDTVIFRLSQKLATKLKVAPATSTPLDANPYADWSAHLFTAQRTQYVIITNTASLYSMVMLGRDMVDDGQFIDAAMTAMQEFMVADGNELIYRRFVAPASVQVQFSKALSRSVTGSMNDLVRCGTFWLVERELSLLDTSFKLNETPMSALNHRTATEAFKAALQVGPSEAGGGEPR